jgi:hypothetical protein
LCGFKGRDSDLKETYYFNGIPFSMLLDKTGTIIEVGLRGEILEAWLKGLYGL